MRLTIPPHIEHAKIDSTIIKYRWDEWHVDQFYAPADERLVKQLQTLSARAQIALTIACAEWVIFRFHQVSQDILPLQYLEAAWAGNVHLAYCSYFETDDDDWRGPVRGPINIALTIINDSLFCEDENPNPAENPAWMSNLATHVLPSTDNFLRWREACVKRLQKCFRAPRRRKDDLFGETDLRGTYVPLEAFDPVFDFQPQLTKDLINNYLQSLDYNANPFLRSPEEMLELGFEGTPYRLK